MRKKADIEIGYRCAEYVRDYAYKNSLDIKTALDRIGLERKALYPWEYGETPSVYALQRLVLSGACADYLLTGRSK